MATADNPRLLHVASGTSTTQTIEAAGIPGRCSIWADPLYEGPVPGGLADEDLIEVRRRYLAGVVAAAPVDPANDLREWRAVIERERYDELVLWFEHDLFDQLNLIQLLAWIQGRLPATTPVSLISVASFPGHPAFKGLGELSPREVASLLPGRQRVSEAQYALANLAWEAFRAPTPRALDGIRRDGTSALPYLGAAVRRFLQEYPWTNDGLSRSERRLLALADGGGVALSQAFPRMHEGEHAYYVTDLTLAVLARELSRTSPPLLALRQPDAATARMLSGFVTLTDTGRAVLAGRLDRVATCGIDRWLGGVHLLGQSGVWRWDEARDEIAGV